MIDSIKIALVVPCYNEESRLNRDAFINALAENPELTFLFVNDGSTDNSAKIIQEICLSNSERAWSLSLEKNKGKGEAVRVGMCYLLEKELYDIIGFWDADLSIPLSEVNRLMAIARLTPGIEAVIGSRIHMAGRTNEHVNIRHYTGRLFATLMCLTFGFKIYDTQCGAKLFKSNILKLAVQEPFCSGWIFDVELILRLSRTPLLKDKDNWLYEVAVNEWRNISGTKRTILAYIKALFDYFRLVRRYLPACTIWGTVFLNSIVELFL